MPRPPRPAWVAVEGSKGKTAGRGTKGTKARYQVPESFEGGSTPLHMRLPKLRGFKNPFKTEYQVVNLDRLSALYPEGGDVTVEDLVAKGAVRDGCRSRCSAPARSPSRSVTADAISARAKEKIEAAGGTAVHRLTHTSMNHVPQDHSAWSLDNAALRRRHQTLVPAAPASIGYLPRIV